MKRVVDDLTAIEGTLEQLFDAEPAGSIGKSSDSSKRTQSFVPKQSIQQFRSSLSQQESSANLMYRLFSERVEIFNDLLDFTKVSVLSNIIKISLKTLLECVRLKSFSKFGLQQIQVDTHYLQLNLWRFVADEK
jgi:vacuolar protein sorting-associated protein 51